MKKIAGKICCRPNYLPDFRINTLYIFVMVASLFCSCSSRKHSVKNKQVAEIHAINGKIDSKPVGKNKKSDAVIAEAEKWVGTPYKYGGNSMDEGVDCSGLVVQVYLNATGIKLPRTSFEQADFCPEIEYSDIAAGDLVFFATGQDTQRVSHVGIMIDGNRFIHSSSRKGVCISELNSPYYQRTLIKFGRIPY